MEKIGGGKMRNEAHLTMLGSSPGHAPGRVVVGEETTRKPQNPCLSLKEEEEEKEEGKEVKVMVHSPKHTASQVSGGRH